ncbi:endonuclease [Helicobacter sp. NHP21005]|uniref:endonuclease n=1 Tax=Helicobacter felistomachi TaxID=3040201 RepID=UPI002572C9EA|nr:endonuclease [Helicobacter sp. NHP21005]BEG57278.1 endonuclease [Helicobacter sp. NHP21005]
MHFSIPKSHNFTQTKQRLIKLYKQHPDHQITFYCQAPFKIIHKGTRTRLEIINSNKYTARNAKTKKGKINQRAWRVEWEHIMPAENFGKHLACWRQGGRKACEKDPTFEKMEADMFNLVPAIGEVNGDRNNYRYAQAPKNMVFNQYGNCKVYTDFKEKRFYPADYSKGWITWAYLHMSQTYGINLSKAEKQLMEAWDKMYPPSKWEMERTAIVKRDGD